MPDSESDPPRSRLLSELYFNRTGLMLALTVLLAIGMYALAAHTHGNASVFWLTLATGMLATSLYTAFAVLLTTSQSNSLLSTTVEQSVRSTISASTDKLLREIRKQSATYLPESAYPPTNSPDPAFNRDLNRSFYESKRYIFQGVTARYNIARLAALDTAFELVRVIVANPAQPDSAVTRVMHSRFGAEGAVSDEELAQVRADVIDDIWVSVVGAYECRRRADRIEFCFLADPPIDRAEIFDRDMFLTRFSDPASWRFEFPAACRFLEPALVYQQQSRESAKLFTSPYTVRLHIPRDDDCQSLFRALAAAGLPFDESRYEHYRTGFWELVRKLPREMTP